MNLENLKFRSIVKGICAFPCAAFIVINLDLFVNRDDLDDYHANRTTNYQPRSELYSKTGVNRDVMKKIQHQYVY